jgi:hypothetical protein
VIEWLEYRKVLNEYAAVIVERAQLELGTKRKINGRNVRRVASGDLQNGLFYTFKNRRGEIVLELNSNQSYATFIHEGVNGTKVNQGSPYSFKKGMVNTDAVRKWVRVKGVRPRRDGKFIPMTESNVNSMVFSISKSIARNGIPALPFFSLAIESVDAKFQDKFDRAIIQDIEVSI